MKAEHDRAWWVPHHIPVQNAGLLMGTFFTINLSLISSKITSALNVNDGKISRPPKAVYSARCAYAFCHSSSQEVVFHA